MDGRLQIRGPGSLYADANGATGFAHSVSRTVAPGAPATYSILVVNTNASLAQYNLKVTPTLFGGEAISVATGSIISTPLATGPDGYYTTPIKPGGAETITIKITPPASSPQETFYDFVALFATDGTPLDSAVLYTNIKAPTTGTTAYDLFATASGSLPVGGSVSGQVATAPALKLAGIATFSVKLRNDSAAASAIGFQLKDNFGCGAFYTTTVKYGSTVVTAAALAGTYVTPMLAAGASRTLTITIKYANYATFDCTGDPFEADSLAGQSGPVQTYVLLNVNAAH